MPIANDNATDKPVIVNLDETLGMGLLNSDSLLKGSCGDDMTCIRLRAVQPDTREFFITAFPTQGRISYLQPP